jgi:hypothetical protein
MFNRRTLAIAAALACFATAGLVTQAGAQSLSHIVAQDHGMKASGLIGLTVTNDKGEVLGKIADIIVKGSATEPMAILSSGSGSTAKMVAVPLSHIGMKNDKASMAMTMADFYAMPGWAFNGLNGGGG